MNDRRIKFLICIVRLLTGEGVNVFDERVAHFVNDRHVKSDNANGRNQGEEEKEEETQIDGVRGFWIRF